MEKSYIFNGNAVGSVAQRLLDGDWDVNKFRPYVAENGRTYITQILNGKPTAIPIRNADATLRYDEWKAFDDAVLRAARPRLKGVADLRSAGLTYTIPNGFGKSVFVTEKSSDPGNPIISMEPDRQSADDRPVYETENLPLPVISLDFTIGARQLQASRNGNTPLDTSMAEAAARRISEEAEKLLLGNSTLWTSNDTWGGGYIYGYTTHPDIETVDVTAPIASGWTGETLIDEILEMQQASIDNYYYGPWFLYFSPGWTRYLGDDFKAASDKTLRQRVSEIGDIRSIGTLDYLSDYKILLVQASSDVVREVIGMDMTTVQWETNGGMRLNFKVMAIMVPQIRSDKNGRCGVVYGS